MPKFRVINPIFDSKRSRTCQPGEFIELDIIKPSVNLEFIEDDKPKRKPGRPPAEIVEDTDVE